MVRLVLRSISVALLVAPGLAAAAPVTVPTKTAPLPTTPGQGACIASAISTSPSTDFPQMAGAFDDGMNAFMEAHAADRVEYVQRTVLDLSNGQDTGPMVSWGDFSNAMTPGCPSAGCPFFMNDTSTSFGARIRGFLAVPAAMANQAVHVGLYLDDAASVTLFDGAGMAYGVLTQPPVLGSSTWRETESVTFGEAGLYPIEIQYAQLVEHAALEVSLFQGAFTDFAAPANQTPVTSLSVAGFTLVGPASLYETVDGAPPFSDPTKCEQCARSTVGTQGSCDAGSYCNEAAICAPCNVAAHCGSTCAACDAASTCVEAMGAYQCAPSGASSSASASAGSTSVTTAASAGTGSDATSSGAGGGASTRGSSGCSCAIVGASETEWSLLLLALVPLLARRRGSGRSSGG